MVVAVLYSGGKDSNLSLHKAVEQGLKVDLLLTMDSKNSESYMFHYPNVRWTALQAKALDMEHGFVKTEGIKEEELDDLEKALDDSRVSTLITGATYSKYQSERINSLCTNLGIEHLAPLWHIEPLVELDEIDRNFNAIITSVSAEGLDSSFLGARIDKAMIEKLVALHNKFGINMLFEGGEAESFVLDAPLFKKRVEVTKSHVEWNGTSGTYFIDSARLADKL